MARKQYRRRYRSKSKRGPTVLGNLMYLLGRLLTWPLWALTRWMGRFLGRLFRSPSIGKKSKTMKGEKVKSLAEKRIADWFCKMGIEYVYEKPVRVWFWHTVTPDFYLPKFDTYIEYHGLLKHPSKGKEYREGVAYKKTRFEAKGIKYRTLDHRHYNRLEAELSKIILSLKKEL